MSLPPLAADQRAVAESDLTSKTFLRGAAGTGKSTAGSARLRYLLERGVAGDSILVLTPQRTLQDPYFGILRGPDASAGGEVAPATLGGLARRSVDLFWPLAAERAGFAFPDRAPTFLTLESAQYYMAHLVRPLLDQGYFESVTMDRNRLYSQIIDNLNKAATVGFPYTEIGARLDAAWFGDPGQRRIYVDAQDCATRFREFCLQHNLLDFSLQIEVFCDLLWHEPLVHEHLLRSYRHLIYDNVEEDVPRAHDLIRDWLPQLESALVIFDEGGGYRRFLGADVQSAEALGELCPLRAVFEHSRVMSAPVQALARAVERAAAPQAATSGAAEPLTKGVLGIITARFYPELLDTLAQEIHSLVNEAGTSPAEIVILAPYLSDALRFAVTSRLEALGIPCRTHRPSRSLNDEPASQTLLTLAALAHPHWNVRPSRFDIAYALKLALDTDLVRAQLLAGIVYRTREFTLSTFDQIKPDMQSRISFTYGNRYTVLRDWILKCRESSPLPFDHFLRRLFGEVLSQEGFGFHRNLDAARVASSLIESVRKFRLAMEPSLVERDHADFDFGREYFTMLQEGVIAAQYLESWKVQGPDAVLVAPAYTFLMANRPAAIQFWLDVGASGWFERLDQPLTHPEVLSRQWPEGTLWTFADEDLTNRQTMARLVSGLLHRCKQRLYLGISSLGESGFEQRGELLKVFQRVLQEQE